MVYSLEALFLRCHNVVKHVFNDIIMLNRLQRIKYYIIQFNFMNIIIIKYMVFTLIKCYSKILQRDKQMNINKKIYTEFIGLRVTKEEKDLFFKEVMQEKKDKLSVKLREYILSKVSGRLFMSILSGRTRIIRWK